MFGLFSSDERVSDGELSGRGLVDGRAAVEDSRAPAAPASSTPASARAVFPVDAQTGQGDTAMAAMEPTPASCWTEPERKDTERRAFAGGASCWGNRIQVQERTITSEQTTEETKDPDIPLCRASGHERPVGGRFY